MSDTSVWSWRGFSACSAASLVLQDLGGPRRGPLGVSLSPIVTGCVRAVLPRLRLGVSAQTQA